MVMQYYSTNGLNLKSLFSKVMNIDRKVKEAVFIELIQTLFSSSILFLKCHIIAFNLNLQNGK